MTKDPTPIKITGWCRCLAILGQDETYVLYILPPFLPPFKNIPVSLGKWRHACWGAGLESTSTHFT